MGNIKYRVWNYKEEKYHLPFNNCSTTYNLGYYENTKHVSFPERCTSLKCKSDINAFAGDIINIYYVSLSSGEKISYDELIEERRLDHEEHASVIGVNISSESDYHWPHIEPGKYKIEDMGYYFHLISMGDNDEIDMISDIFGDERLEFEIVGNIHEN